jgi:hypothetical protein
MVLGACAGTEDDGAESTEEGVVSNVHVLTSRNDTNRTGANLKEKVLKTANVKTATFGKVYTRNLDGQVFAQPLYVGGVNGKNVVYVATEHNSVYAFDADNRSPNAPPLWQKNFGTPVPSQDTGCGLLTPEIGITSTPVIDLQAKTMWFTTRNKENGKYLHRLHALDIATGAPKAGSPVEITAQAPGTGSSSVNGMVKFDPLRTHNRPGLLKVGSKIYIGFASLCDIAPYHGWVLAYDATTLQQKAVLVTTPNGGEGGIWNGGVGLNADESGDLYVVAGDVYPNNPNATPFNGQDNLGNSIVRLKDTGSALVPQTSFTPFDTRIFSPQDRSLGNNGGILIPGTNLFIAGDKRGQTFVVDRNNMGGTAQNDAQVVQKFQGTARGMWGGSTYYKKGPGGIYYIWGNGDRLKAYKFNGQKFDLPPMVNTNTLIGYPGGQTSLSADGEVDGTAILWAVRGKRTSPGLAASTGSGVLHAFNANNITEELWNSDMVPADALGNAAKFAPPTIANGRVFVGTSSNQLVVYGLKSGNPDEQDAGMPDTGATQDAGSDAPVQGGTPTWTQIYANWMGPGTPGHCSGTGGCHTNIRGGFKCGTSKTDCYSGLVAAGLITPGNPAQSPLGKEGDSPLAWLGGGMPLDNDAPNPAGAAAIKAWVQAGAPNN